MRITTANGGQEEFAGEAVRLTEQDIDSLNSREFDHDHAERLIDNMDVSADAKAHLHSISEWMIHVTTKAGHAVVWIGRKLLDIALYLLREFPNATFGVVLGLLLGYIASMIPVIGFLIAPIVGTVAVLAGGIKGVSEDLQQKDIQQRIAELCTQLNGLKTPKRA